MAPRGTQTILIVDDNEEFRGILRDLVSSEFPWADVHEAENGARAQELFDTYDPYLVFMDLNIPSPSGLMVIGAIKASCPDCVVIVFTGHDSREYREATSALGADHFLSKQHDGMEDVLALLKKYTDPAAFRFAMPWN